MSVRTQFLAEIAKPPERIDVERCALLYAAALQPGLQIDDAMRALDDQVNGFLAAHPGFEARAPLNSRYLVALVGDVLGYAGDSVEYYSPDNSLLDRVIETRLGIPITLAAIYIAIGKRLGIGVRGVGFPGHFLIRITEPDGAKTVVDPFSHAIVGAAQLRHMCEEAARRFGGFDPRWLEDAHPHDMLVRMLENLKGVCLRGNDPAAAQTCLDYQLLLKPDDGYLLRQLQAFMKNSRNDGPRLN